MGKTFIEWATESWNPLDGCTEVSEGCDHCYARVIAHRFAGSKAFPNGFALTLHPERLDQPLHWRKPRRVFVNSMSDLFHKDVPDEYILGVFEVMLRTPRHTYFVLTKRPSRLANTGLLEKMLQRVYQHVGVAAWPSHIWMGVSIEMMKYAWRIAKLREAFASYSANPLIDPTFFISAEPLLEELTPDLTGVAWLITGCESGTSARPMQEDWVRLLRDQCNAADVAFFYKQKLVNRKKVGLPMLDGRQWAQYPARHGGIA